MRSNHASLHVRKIRIWVLILGLVLLSACGRPASGPQGASGTPSAADRGEQNQSAADARRIPVTIGVGGQATLVYLPTTLAERLGYYAEEGLDVTIQDFQGGSKALEALLGGSVDVVSGFYDHTIQLATQGQKLKAFVTMLQYPGMILVVSPSTKKDIKTLADLKGAVVGVSAPGSSTHLFINYLLSKEGMNPQTDISVTGIGLSASAIAAMEKGQVDAAVLLDPAYTVLKKRFPELTILADTSTPEGVQEIFGTDTYPASVLYSKAEWIEANPEAAKRLARAIQKTLRWMQEHDAQAIAERMPPEFYGDDRETYIEALSHARPMFSPDGFMHQSGAEAVKKVLSISIEDVRKADVDVQQTYTNDLLSQ
ncbi:MAG: ABC transporter substrate-binding protein [Hydrogenibacillus sp.]|nr:ABC transporter substrate-binding protein [Hydrogenibacillus sp.]